MWLGLLILSVTSHLPQRQSHHASHIWTVAASSTPATVCHGLSPSGNTLPTTQTTRRRGRKPLASVPPRVATTRAVQRFAYGARGGGSPAGTPPASSCHYARDAIPNSKGLRIRVECRSRTHCCEALGRARGCQTTIKRLAPTSRGPSGHGSGVWPASPAEPGPGRL